jgi:hypothetical protein
LISQSVAISLYLFYTFSIKKNTRRYGIDCPTVNKKPRSYIAWRVQVANMVDQLGFGAHLEKSSAELVV